VGSVVKGFDLKQAVCDYLRKHGHEILDVGCYDKSVFVKFPSIAERAARALQQGQADRGILCCGTGTGMALAAGKFQGLCAVGVESPLAAELARKVNDANVLCLGESLVTPEQACRLAEVFLTTEFQDAPGVPAEIREFWAEARAEISSRGAEATEREIEGLAADQ
jgi:ribose 5-phosphate isomerase B